MNLNKGLLLIAVFTFGFISSCAQVKYDKSLNCDKIISADGTFHLYNDAKGNLHRVEFPVNSSISFKYDWDSLVLPSASAEIAGDTLKIYLNRYRISQRIDVYIYVVKNKPTVKIYFLSAMPGLRELKADKINLVINNKKLKTGDELIGKINVSFSGTLVNEESLNDKGDFDEEQIKGEIDGCFNIKVSTLFEKNNWD